MHSCSDPSTRNRPLAWERPALASGVLFGLGQVAATAYFVGVVAPHLPPLDAPASDQADFYIRYASENALVDWLYVLPVPLFLFFLGGLFGLLRRLEDGVGVLTATAIGAGVALAMVWPIGIVAADAGQGMARQGLEPATVLAFDGVAQLMLALSALPRVVLLVAASLGLRHNGTAPRWLSWTGLGLAVVSLAGTGTLLDASVYPLLALGTLLFDVWIACVGGILLRRVAAESPNRLPRPVQLAA